MAIGLALNEYHWHVILRQHVEAVEIRLPLAVVGVPERPARFAELHPERFAIRVTVGNGHEIIVELRGPTGLHAPASEVDDREPLEVSVVLQRKPILWRRNADLSAQRV